MKNETMRIWLYNDPSCCRFLNNGSSLYREQPADLIVEVSKGRSFEYFYNMEAPEEYVGLSGLLYSGNSPMDFSIKPNSSDFPIIFSQGDLPSIRTLGRGLKILSTHPERPAHVDVFLDIDLFRDLAGWIHGLGSLGILYDLSVTPEADLPRLASGLGESGLLKENIWLGLHCYDSMAPGDLTKAGFSDHVISLVQSLPNSGFISC